MKLRPIAVTIFLLVSISIATRLFAESPQMNDFDLAFIHIGTAEMGLSYAKAFEKLGYYYSQQGEHKDDKKAVTCFRRAISLDKKLHLSWFALGMNRMENPKIYFKRVIALKPDFAEAHYWLASYYLNVKRIPESIQYFKSYLAVVDKGVSIEQGRIKTARFDIQQMEAGITDYDAVAENQDKANR